MTRTELARAAREFLQRVPLAENFDFPTPLEQYLKESNINKKGQTNARYYVRKLNNWALSKGWIAPVIEKKSPMMSEDHYRFFNPNNLTFTTTASEARLTDRKMKTTFALGKVEGDYLNKNLNIEFEDFKKHLIEKYRSSDTREVTLDHVARILGWFVRYKNKKSSDSLDEEKLKTEEALKTLSFAVIIPFVKIKILKKDFKIAGGKIDREAYRDALDLAEEEAEEASKYTVELIREFLAFYSNVASTRTIFIEFMLRLAKFIYRTETVSGKNFTDIPTVLCLKELKDTESPPNNSRKRVVPLEKKTLETWHEVVKVFKGLKFEAEEKYIKNITKRQSKIGCKNSGGGTGDKRRHVQRRICNP